MNSGFRPQWLLAGLVSMLLLAGCAQHSSLRSLNVVSGQLAAATQIDVVLVHDATAQAQLPKDNATWFVQRAALEQALGKAIQVLHYEAPAERQFSAAIPHHTAQATYVYNNNPTTPPANLSGWHCAQMTLSDNGVQYTPCAPRRCPLRDLFSH